MEKEIKEILRQQLQLLAERSEDCLDEMLPDISRAMVEIYRELSEI